MTISCEADAINWINKNIQKVSIKNPISIHINNECDAANLLERSLKLFEFILNCDLDLKVNKPILVIPLKPVQIFSKEIIQFNQCTELLSDEPPSIYIVNRSDSKICERCEEYKLPVNVPIITQKTDIFLYAFYREFRNFLGITNDWEYERCLYLEAYPHELVDI